MSRAQSSTIGVVLLVAMTVTSAGVVVTLGATAIDGTQESTEVTRAEHAMTLFDARAAMVALGDTSAQTVTLGRSGDGQYEADADAGWLRITHRNATPGDDEVLYNASLGAVTYTNRETTVAYQGGGVWRHADNGTTMVSPPEFHYRDATLTLPVIRVTDGDAAGGPTRVLVERSHDTVRVFPNAARSYTNNSSRKYYNPIRSGTVSVTVHSDYYRGWATYFRQRTTGNVTVDHDAETATLVLQTVGGEVGDFVLPSKGDGVDMAAVDSGHALDDFDVDVRESGGTFNNMKFSFYVENGSKQMEVLLRVDKDRGNCNVKSGDTLSMWVLYENQSGPKHAWYNDSIPADSGPIRLECDGKDTRIVVDYLSDVPLTMGDPSIPTHTGTTWDDPTVSTVSFNHSGYAGENETHSFGDEQPVGELTEHYLALMGSDYQLKVYHGGGQSGTAHIDGGASTGSLFYNTTSGSRYITYLHVTENNVTADFR